MAPVRAARRRRVRAGGRRAGRGRPVRGAGRVALAPGVGERGGARGAGRRAGRGPGAMSAGATARAATPSARSMLLPLALAQFIASYACTNMNVAVTAIAKDLGTTVIGVQTAITLFT